MQQLHNEQNCSFLHYLIKKTTPFVILGIVYYIWLRMTHIYIPCIFRYITGYKCPGCGTTTMCVSILRFRFGDAFYANPFIFTTIPFIMLEIVYNVYLSYIISHSVNLLKIIPIQNLCSTHFAADCTFALFG